jgi:hypothetical protein
MMRRTERGEGEVLAIVFVLLIVVVVSLLLWGFPQYRIYNNRLRGEAALREAEFNRQIRVQEAQANWDAAKLDRQSEVERARGVAEANEIVSEGLGGPEGYLRYLWIQGLHDGSSEVIYIPTEANLPILEAQRLAPPTQ